MQFDPHPSRTRHRTHSVGMRRAGFTYVALGILQRGLSLLLLPFVTRAMSVPEYGAVSVLVAIGAFATALLGAPLQAPITRWSAKPILTAQENLAMGVGRGWLAYIAPLALILSATSAAILLPHVIGLPMLLVAGELIAAALGLHLTYFTLPLLRGKSRLRQYVALATIYICTSVITKIVLVIVLRLGAPGWVVSDLLAAALGYLTSMFFSRNESCRLTLRGARQLWSFSAPLVAQSIMTWSMQSLSRPIAAILMPLAQVGLYAASLNAVGAAMMLVIEFNKSTAVTFSRSRIKTQDSDVAVAARTQRLLGTAVSLGMLAATPIFVSVILPPEYNEATLLLAIVALAPILIALYDLPMNFLIYSEGVTRLSWLPTTVGAGAQAAALFVLAPTLESVGAAIATVAAYFLMTITAFALPRFSNIRIHWTTLGLGPLDILLTITATVPLLLVLTLGTAQSTYALALALGILTVLAMAIRDRRKPRPGGTSAGLPSR